MSKRYMFNGSIFRLGNNGYAQYFHKGIWRESASISNQTLTVFGVCQD